MARLQTQPNEDVMDLLEVFVSFWESIPLFVWVVAGLLLLLVLRNAMRQANRQREEPGDDVIDRRRTETRVSREGYSIHDNVDTRDRTYTEPSEYDEIRTPNEVNRGIMAKIRTLVDLVGGRRRGERD